MRIIGWNCQGAFRLKANSILELAPDLIIILECESADKLMFSKNIPQPNDFIWYSDTNKKGVGIFSYSDYKLELLKEFNPLYRYVIPIKVYNNTNSFILIAIWAMDNKADPLSRYIGQVWNAINYYTSLLNENCIIIGDFNSNKIWDEKERIGNHTDVVNFLSTYNIESLYHKQYQESQGEESISTLFLHRKLNRPYHIDYIFASKLFIDTGFNITLGKFDEWIDKSDHVPMIVDLNDFYSSIQINNTFIDVYKRQTNNFSGQMKIKFADELNILESLAINFDNENSVNDATKKWFQMIEKLSNIDINIRNFASLRESITNS